MPRARRLKQLPSQGNPSPQRIIDQFLRSCRRELRSRLSAVVLSGGLARRDFRVGWSDIDILVVIKELDLKTQTFLSSLKQKVLSRYKVKIGLNVITEAEAVAPRYPEFTIDGKVLQTLWELSRHPERLLYGNTEKLFVPTPDVVRAYSLLNIPRVLMDSRKALLSATTKTARDLRSLVAAQVRSAFICTKLALQHVEKGEMILDYPDLIRLAQTTFPEFEFTPLVAALRCIEKWPQVNERELGRLFQRIQRYNQTFPNYFCDKIGMGAGQ